MKVTGRDLLFATVIVVVLGILLMSTGTGKAPRVPVDVKHQPFRKRLATGTGRFEIEHECFTCHSDRGIPLSSKHPPKEQCLVCHPMKPE